MFNSQWDDTYTCLYEYIWIDGYNNLRSKTKVIKCNHTLTLDELPHWNYDGSSTNQAPGSDSEVILKPVALYTDPFRKNSYLVLCDTWLPNGDPHPTNTRVNAVSIFNKAPDLKPMFGIEQEFFLSMNRKPIGHYGEKTQPQQDYYCGIGGDNAIGRECIEEAFNRCLKAGLNLTGMNGEVAPSQWEIQVCAEGIEAADQLWILRYIVNRTAETYGWTMDLRPKPLSGDWNGSGCHINFSTQPMREECGYKIILDAIKKLKTKHSFHMQHYGVDNDKRMTGAHETARYDTFSYGVANRGCSVRIPRETEANGCGYFEDRRPASNMDPYVVTSLIFQTTSFL
mgnify:CR=1 FL=1